MASTVAVATRLTTGIAFALLSGSVVLAHHSSAMYDASKLVTMRGVVTEFRWTNPHVTISMTADAAPGEDGQLWILEATSPGNLSRVGWTRTSIERGARVEIVIAPLKNGEHGGWCRTVTIVDTGRKLEC